MYSVFSSPTLTERRNVHLENNIAARKPGQLSTRKPFADRSVNSTQKETPVLVKPNIIPKPIVEKEPTFDFSMYTCSTKKVKDTYNDILQERDTLGENGKENIIRLFLSSCRSEPSIANFDFTPEIIEMKPDVEEFDTIKISAIFKTDFSVGISEVPFPEIDFDF